MADSVNMSLDEIIKKNQQLRVSRSRGRGGRTNRGRGGGRGGGITRGGGVARGRGRRRSQSRAGTPARSRSRGPRVNSQMRSRSRGPRENSQIRSKPQTMWRSNSQPRLRSRSRQRRSNSRARSGSRSRSQLRGITPKGRAGLEDQQSGMPALVRGRFRGRGGNQNRLQRFNSVSSLHGGVHSRLGVVTHRGGANLRRPLAVAKRGISKLRRGLSTGNRYTSVGLRSDQILKEQRQNLMYQNNIIKSQTFRRSRNNSLSMATDMTVTVDNDFMNKRRRNSVGSANYLNKRSLAQLNNHYEGNNIRRGPGSVKSMGSNRSKRSNRSNGSYGSQQSNRSRGRGRGANRGVGRKFNTKTTLNADIQKQIAYLQGKGYGNHSVNKVPEGFDDFTPTPVTTSQTLHERFAF